MAGGSIRSLVKRSAELVDRVRPRQGLTILIYHRVGGRTPVSVDLPRDLFAEQIAHLAEHCDVLTLDAAADVLSGRIEPTEPDRQQVVVTFDDGTADFVDEAVPVLVEHGVPALMFLATDFVDNQRRFPDDGIPMTWAGARDAQSTGLVGFGSHTDSHALLDRLTPAATAVELDRSIDLIAEHLGQAPEHFAYPRAVLGNRAAQEAVRARFRTAALAGTRPNPVGTELHRLSRSPIQVGDGMRWFRQKVAGGMGLEDDVRGVLNRWRYRETGN